MPLRRLAAILGIFGGCLILTSLGVWSFTAGVPQPRPADPVQAAAASTSATVPLPGPDAAWIVVAPVAQRHGVSALAFSPDGRFLAVASHDGPLLVWDRHGGGVQQLPDLRRRMQTFPVNSHLVQFGPDGRLVTNCLIAEFRDPRWVLTADHQASVSENSWEEMSLFPFGDTGGVAGLAVGPGGRLAFGWKLGGAINGNGLVAALALRTNDAKWVPLPEAAEKDLNRNSVHALAMSPDGRTVALCGCRLWEKQGVVRLLEFATGALRWRFPLQVGTAGGLAFAPDGRTLAVGMAALPEEPPALVPGWGKPPPREVILLDVATGRPRRFLEGHAGNVHAVAYAPDGKLLATAGEDATVRLWDPATGGLRGQLCGHEETVRTLAFSPDGSVLASGGDEGIVFLWPVPHSAASP